MPALLYAEWNLSVSSTLDFAKVICVHFILSFPFNVCVSASVACRRGLVAYGPAKSGNQHSCVRAGIGLTNLCVQDAKPTFPQTALPCRSDGVGGGWKWKDVLSDYMSIRPHVRERVSTTFFISLLNIDLKSYYNYPDSSLHWMVWMSLKTHTQNLRSLQMAEWSGSLLGSTNKRTANSQCSGCCIWETWVKHTSAQSYSRVWGLTVGDERIGGLIIHE